MPKKVLDDKSKIARSRSLAMLGKSTSRTKNGIIQTKDLFQGIHRTKDVRPPTSDEEHLKRVWNKEHTPWVASTGQFSQRFAPVKDTFVAKYQPLLDMHSKQNRIDSLALSSRKKLLKENAEQQKLNELKKAQQMILKISEQQDKLLMRDGRVYDIRHLVDTVQR